MCFKCVWKVSKISKISITECRRMPFYDRIFLKLQWKLSENCQFAVFRLGPWLPRSWDQIWIMPSRKTYSGQDFSYSGALVQSNQNFLPEKETKFINLKTGQLISGIKIQFEWVLLNLHGYLLEKERKIFSANFSSITNWQRNLDHKSSRHYIYMPPIKLLIRFYTMQCTDVLSHFL